MRIGTMITPLPRRRPQKLARETVSIDHLSKGRLILGVGSGGSAGEYANMGEAETPQERGALLDEGLEILTRLWSGEEVNYVGEHLRVTGATFLPVPVQQPRIPIWVAGMWPNKKPMQRAARYDGVFPQTRATGLDSMVALDDMREAIEYVARERGNRDFDVAHSGRSSGIPLRDRLIVGPYADIGVTWWLENMTPWAFGWSGEGDWPLAAMRDRIAQGPPQI
jgi:alkanesulfonate monooxygenase SsuD/methylene tetrahydromethanopterin reductase-like flavin-dependent oxidoreductase (luciferase family)